jgi:cell division protein FtsI (penicillin-binding protein 3)/stage V sporulation protein D (sporulation-specific penicillin-binding protein)
VAEKTGTAQIFEGNFPKKETNHTVTGFAPVNDPQIVMVVKIGEPTNTAQFAEGDAGPAFRDIMCTTLKYLNIPGNDECLDKIKH